jgi:hypothetical protein
MTGLQSLRQISPQQFAQLGLADIAYVKPVTVNDEHGFAIHAADGTPMGMVRDRDVAMAAVRQHDLEPVSVH